MLNFGILNILKLIKTDCSKSIANANIHLEFTTFPSHFIITFCCVTYVGQRPAAIVSPQAGTTRDVLESALDICGYPVVIRCVINPYNSTTRLW